MDCDVFVLPYKHPYCKVNIYLLWSFRPRHTDTMSSSTTDRNTFSRLSFFYPRIRPLELLNTELHPKYLRRGIGTPIHLIHNNGDQKCKSNLRRLESAQLCHIVPILWTGMPPRLLISPAVTGTTRVTARLRRGLETARCRQRPLERDFSDGVGAQMTSVQPKSELHVFIVPALTTARVTILAG